MTVLFLLFLQSVTANNQTQPPPKPELSESVKTALANQKAALENQITKGDLELAAKIQPWYLFLSLSGLSVIGVISLLFRIRPMVDAKVEKEIGKRALELFAAVDERARTRMIQEKYRILILNRDGNSSTRAHLVKWGFQSLHLERFETVIADLEACRQPFKDWDLVLFDKLGEDEINQVMTACPNQFCVGFNPKHLKLKHPDYINMANTKMTLFTRILETARYREHLSSSRV